jgi:hypothetical protein
VFFTGAIPDVNGRPKHDNPFGKAMEKDAMIPLITQQKQH